MILNGNNKPCPYCSDPSHIFRYLSEEESNLLENHRYVVHYKPYETIFKQGSPITHVISFDHGLAKMHYQTSEDKDLIIRLVKPIELIAGVGLFLDNKHHYTLTTIDHSSICMIDSTFYKGLLKSNAAFNEAYLVHIHHMIAESQKKMISLSHKNTLGRIAESLLYLSDKIYLSDSFITHMSKIELSEFAGVSRESAFKAINELQSSGIVIINGNQIQIINKALLNKISEAG